MIYVEDFFSVFERKKVNFFTGVPDSVLKKMSVVLDRLNKYKHIIATNEGSAVSLAVGYYLAKKKMAAVYLQNSGLGNAINPLISIAHQNVYSIPMVLVIGWRGSPNLKKDEAQHLAQGKSTIQMLKLLGINSCRLKEKSDLKKLSNLISYSKKNNKPVACLIENKTLALKKKYNIKKENRAGLKRSYVLETILNNIKQNTKIISTTGYTSRELDKIRKSKNLNKGSDFYMVGGMGHSSMVALGLALNSSKNILCIDGDGAILMHLGALSVSGNLANKNFKHILLNNSSHESVGGQKTLADKINFEKLSLSLGYKKFYRSNIKKAFNKNLKNFLNSNGPSFFEVKIINEALPNLSRPNDLKKIKINFLQN